MQSKTITVQKLRKTPDKGIFVTTMANEEYSYSTAEINEAVGKPGDVANITFDEKTNKIIKAMFITNMPDVIKLSEKLDAAKEKTAALIKQNAEAKIAPSIPAPIIRTPVINPMNKSVAISYSKDLLIAGKIGTDDLLPVAEVFYRYMIGELEVANLYKPLLTNTKLQK
jgi:hypothetical protein